MAVAVAAAGKVLAVLAMIAGSDYLQGQHTVTCHIKGKYSSQSLVKFTIIREAIAGAGWRRDPPQWYQRRQLKDTCLCSPSTPQKTSHQTRSAVHPASNNGRNQNHPSDDFLCRARLHTRTLHHLPPKQHCNRHRPSVPKLTDQPRNIRMSSQ